MLGLLFFSLRGTITNVFYSLKDSTTPAKNATIGVLINLALNLSLPFVMGINGLVLATALSAIYITGMLVILLLKKHKEFNLAVFFKNFEGIVVASFLTAVPMIACKYFLKNSPVLASFCIGCFCYLVCARIMRVPIFVMFIDMIKKKRN